MEDQIIRNGGWPPKKVMTGGLWWSFIPPIYGGLYHLFNHLMMVHSCFTHITTWDSKQLELRIQATSMGKCSTNRSDVQRIGKRDAGNHVFFVPHTKVFLQCYFILFLCFNGVSLNMVPWLCVDNASSTATNVWPWETGNHSHFGDGMQDTTWSKHWKVMC